MEKVRKRRKLCLWLMVVVCSDVFLGDHKADTNGSPLGLGADFESRLLQGFGHMLEAAAKALH